MSVDQVPIPAARTRRLNLADAVGASLNLLWVGAVVLLAYLSLALLLGAQNRAGEMEAGAWSLALAAAVYLLGHGFRALRLALLIGGWRVGMRTIASFQLMTAAVTLAIPLKLGEVYRLAELSRLAGGFVRAVVITWWERLFDAVALLLILGFALAALGDGERFRGLMVLLGLFVAATAIVVFVVPDNLRRLAVLIIRRYRDPRSVPVLACLDLVRRSILEAPRMVRNKVATLFALTVLIWTANAAVFVIALPAVRGSVVAASAALLRFLTSVTEGQTLPGALASADVSTATASLSQAPLALIGLAAALYYGWLRLRTSKG